MLISPARWRPGGPGLNPSKPTWGTSRTRSAAAPSTDRSSKAGTSAVSPSVRTHPNHQPSHEIRTPPDRRRTAHDRGKWTLSILLELPFQLLYGESRASTAMDHRMTVGTHRPQVSNRIYSVIGGQAG